MNRVVGGTSSAVVASKARVQAWRAKLNLGHIKVFQNNVQLEVHVTDWNGQDW